MICDYCSYRNSYDCADGWNKRNNCNDFKLDWNMLSEKDKSTIQKILANRDDLYEGQTSRIKNYR